MKLFKPTILALLMSSTFFTKSFSQDPGTDVFLSVNLPGLLYAGNISKYAKNPIGLSLTGRIFLSEKIALVPSIRYDNFKYQPLNKRVGDYAQFKMGLTYFDNLLGEKFSKFFHKNGTSYFLAECGLGVKLNQQMIGNKNCLAYSVGYGFRMPIGERMIADACLGWVNLKLATGITASWVDYRAGAGYRLKE
jgi:hypothetical protein